MIYLVEAPTFLREQSDRYAGIPHYLAAADAFDRALSEFFKVQTVENLRTVNGTYARVSMLRDECAVEDRRKHPPSDGDMA